MGFAATAFLLPEQGRCGMRILSFMEIRYHRTVQLHMRLRRGGYSGKILQKGA
ncbi:hypothetical protein D3C75_477080 [compost metagenome]